MQTPYIGAAQTSNADLSGADTATAPAPAESADAALFAALSEKTVSTGLVLSSLPQGPLGPTSPNIVPAIPPTDAVTPSVVGVLPDTAVGPALAAPLSFGGSVIATSDGLSSDPAIDVVTLTSSQVSGPTSGGYTASISLPAAAPIAAAGIAAGTNNIPSPMPAGVSPSQHTPSDNPTVAHKAPMPVLAASDGAGALPKSAQRTADVRQLAVTSLANPLAVDAADQAGRPLTLTPAQPFAGSVATPVVDATRAPGAIGVHAASQVADAISIRANERSVTVRLDPPELGIVRIEFTFERGTVTAIVAADQASTGDLLRRHSDWLQQALAESGIEDASIDWYGTGDDLNDDGSKTGFRLGIAGGTSPDGSTLSAAPQTLLAAARGGIDIRL